MLTLSLCLSVTSARAGTLTVSTSGKGDYTSIQAAIDESSDGDTITVEAGTYTESLDFDGKDVAVSSTEGSSTTFLAGTGEYAVRFDSGETANAVFTGFTLESGPTAGGIHIRESGPTITDVVVDRLGSGTDNGGGVDVLGGTPTLTDCTFDSTLGEYGGAIYVGDGAVVTIQNAWFDNTYGAVGGAIYVDGSTLDISDSTLDSTYSAESGGGIAALNKSTVTLTDTDITETRTSAGNGFAIYADYATVVTWNGGTNAGSYSDTVASGSTGSVYVSRSSTFNATGVTFENIVSGDTGAVAYISGGYSGTIDGCTFTDNSGASGGAIYAKSGDVTGTLTVTSSTFSGNYASLRGGAIFVTDQFAATIAENEFDDNTTDQQGGAVYLTLNGTATLTGNNFVGNSADVGGGAIAVVDIGSALTLDSNTFDADVGAYHGGDIYASDNDVTSTGNSYSAASAEFGADFNGEQGGNARFQDDTFDGSYEGSAVYVLGTEFATTTVSVDGSTFTDNSDAIGGAIHVEAIATLTITDSTFTGNATTYDDGGAIWSEAVVDQSVTNSLFCTNTAGGSGGAAYITGTTGSDSWQHNIFCSNTAESGAALYFIHDHVASVVNNDFLDNGKGTWSGTAILVDSAVDWDNNIVANSIGYGLYADDAASAANSSLTYNDWYNNTTDVGGYFTASDISGYGNITSNPDFTAYTVDGDCTNDDLTLAPGSPLIDAGDPTHLDADGSRSDIGRYGGDGATVPVDTGGDTGSASDTATTADSGADTATTADTGTNADTGPNLDSAAPTDSNPSADGDSSADNTDSTVQGVPALWTAGSCGCAAADVTGATPALGLVLGALLLGRRRQG